MEVILYIAVPIFLFIMWKVVFTSPYKPKNSIEKWPDNWTPILLNRVPITQKLPPHLLEELKARILSFINYIPIIGCEDQVIDDEVKVTIAGQACILLLGKAKSRFKILKVVYVYPRALVSERLERNNGSFIHRGKTITMGLSSSNGEVVLSWESTKYGASNIFDGKNVTMHEFAHQLDQADGSADGIPMDSQSTNFLSWADLIDEEYQKLTKKASQNKRTLLQHYGATNPAEFFAVATEAFFEKGSQLKRKKPEMYKALKEYYQLDPANW